MAKLKPAYNQTDIGVAINRSNGQPLDSTQLWVETDGENDTVYTQLLDYAKSDQAFVGQIVTYIDIDGNAYHFTIVGEGANGSLVSLTPKFSYTDGILDIQMGG